MPKRSLSSRVLRWPEPATVLAAASKWATAFGPTQPDLLGIGYVGSYARGDWGVGSDLDLVLVLRRAEEPFHERAGKFERPRLPVPVDLVYTTAEVEAFQKEGRRFGQVLDQELKWLWQGESPAPVR